MRFGSIHRMACRRDIGVRIELAHGKFDILLVRKG